MPGDGSLAGRPAPGAGAALTAAVLGFFIITIDALGLNVALPAIRDDLGGGITGLQWVVDGYTLMFAALLLSAGALSDRIGARQALGAGLIVFVATSAACGLAPNLGVLVAARLLQGAGAAVMLPATLALIRQAYPDPVRRARAISVWAMGGAVALAAGPVAGGLLTLLSWRTFFFVNLPVGLAALLLLTRIARSERRPAPFDGLGQLAAIVAMGALTYAAIEAGAAGPTVPRVLAALALAVVALAVFLTSQARGKNPMVPLDLLRSRTMAVAVTVGFALNVGFYGVVFVVSLYLQQVRGLTALETGMAFVPMAVLVAGVNAAAARVAERFGPRVTITGGQLLLAASLLIFSAAPADAPNWLLIVLLVPLGLGGAMAVPSLTAVLLDSVPAERAGTASGILNTCRQLGGALAVAVFGALVANRATFLHGLRVSLLSAAALLIVTTMAGLLLRPSTPR
ncbi:MFS transporter [Streptomyces acidicola]